MPGTDKKDEPQALGTLSELSSPTLRQGVDDQQFKMYDHKEEERKKASKLRKKRPSQREGYLTQKLEDFGSNPGKPSIRRHQGGRPFRTPSLRGQRESAGFPPGNDFYDGVSTQSHRLPAVVPPNHLYGPIEVATGFAALAGQLQITATALTTDSASPSTDFSYAPQSPEEATRSAPQVAWSQFGGGEQQTFGQGFSLLQAAPNEASFLSGGDHGRPLLVNTNVPPTSLDTTRAGADASEMFSPISSSSTIDSTSSFGVRLDSNPFYDLRNSLQYPHHWHWQLPHLRTELLPCGCMLVSNSLAEGWIGLIPALGNHENSSSYSSPRTPLSGSLGAMAMYSPQALSPDAEFSLSNVAGPSTRRDEN